VGQFGLLLFKIANSDYYYLVPWGSFFFLPLGLSDREVGGGRKRRGLTQTSLFKIPGNISLRR